MSTASDAIERSLIRNEIIHIPYNPTVFAELHKRSDGMVVARAEYELHGTDPDSGRTWRVYMERQE